MRIENTGVKQAYFILNNNLYNLSMLLATQ